MIFDKFSVCSFFHIVALWIVVIGLLVNQLNRIDEEALLKPSIQSPNCANAESVHYSENIFYENKFISGYMRINQAGTIIEITPESRLVAESVATQNKLTFYDHGQYYVTPGLIDTHVHVSAIGGRGWEGYDSACQAAAAGGITTIVTMPLNSIPPTIDIPSLNDEISEATSRSVNLYADVGFWGGGVPSNVNDGSLSDFVKDQRVLGIKSFLSPLPPTAGFEAVTVDQLRTIARYAADANIPLLVHCELMTLTEIQDLRYAAEQKGDYQKYSNYLATRPSLFEKRAIKELIDIVLNTPNLHAHVVHLSDSESLDMINSAKQKASEIGNKLTIETCPHYLKYDSETIKEGNTLLKCMPPIRNSSNREKLWKGLEDGTIDMLTSDHSPCLPEMRKLKSGNFLDAWGGISGLQFSLQVTWTEARNRGYSVEHIIKWWSEMPARLGGFWMSKGSLDIGKRADFVVWDPNSYAITDRSYHRHSGSPYIGDKLFGQIRNTFLGGVEVFRYDEDYGSRHPTGSGCGRILKRS
jgi:allantoinase